MDIVGIDIAIGPRPIPRRDVGRADRTKFDVALLAGWRIRQSAFTNTEAGFQQFLVWLGKHRPEPSPPLHVCMEATGNWGLELADALHANGVRVSVVNPARVKAYGASELARNKTDRLPTPASWARRGPRRRRVDRPVLPSSDTTGLDATCSSSAGAA